MTDTPETEQHTGVGVFLIPAETDPIVAASSEQAHMTTIWMGTIDDLNVDTAEHPQIDIDELMLEVRQYAAELTPITVPVADPSRGLLGDDDADVVFLQPTDALVALRDGLLQEEQVGSAYRRVEQYPEWTPHVTMGYPETPAAAEYDGDAVTFDRVGLWIGPDQYEYPMGGAMSDIDQLRARATALVAAATAEIPEVTTTRGGLDHGSAPTAEELAGTDEEMPTDELDDGEEPLIEIPVHGVATLEGKPTGDGRGFRAGALSFGRLPAPLGFEFEHGHGSNNSRVATIGRIDEFWTVPSPTEGDGVFEVRWRGVIDVTRDYAPQAVQGIVDGSYDGVSIIIDSVTQDVSEQRAEMRALMEAEASGKDMADSLGVEGMLDRLVGDGTQQVNWLSAARIRRFDMVPTGAFEEGYIALGSEFADELTGEQLAIAASALEDCGCAEAAEVEAIVAAAHWFEAYRQVPAEQRKKLADEGKAMPDGSFPIANVEDLRNAIQAIGRAKDPAAAKAHIKKRARDLGEEALIPEGWGTWVDEAWDHFAPGTHDGPGWITHPNATSRIRRYWVHGKGAAKIAWGTPGDFNRCRAQLVKYVQNPDWLAGLCSNMHKEALGVWPGQEAGGRRAHGITASATPAPLFTIVAAVEPVDAAFFRRRELANPRVGLVVDGDAVYGYIAQWNVCHIGNPRGANVCTPAPHSKSNYGLFRTGTVATTEGPIPVGQITMGIGHAGVYDTMETAASHYDNTNAAVADIACGEDNFGIWFAGRLRPTATDEQRYALAASGRLSGDWRPYGSGHELIAALAVNVPGYPIPEVAIAASAGEPGAILAAGIILPEEINEPYIPEEEESTVTLSTNDIAGIAIAAAETVVAKLSAGGITAGGEKHMEINVGEYVRPLAEDTVEDQQEITADLSVARAAFATRLLADARSAAKSKGI